MRVATCIIAFVAVRATVSPPSERVFSDFQRCDSEGDALDESMRTEMLQNHMGLASGQYAKRTVRKIAWVHIPKCGTSFGTTIVHYANPSLPREAALEDKLWQFLEEYPESNWFPDNMLWTGVSRFGHAEIKDKTWQMYNGYFCALFRAPAERLNSMFQQRNSEIKLGIRKEAYEVSEYAERMQGHMTRMISGQHNGHWTDDYNPLDDFPPDVQLALDRLDGFMFLGITEEYDLSVCLFHAMYGGECLDVEFLNVRPGNYTEENPFENVSDLWDQALYEKASNIYSWNKARHSVSDYTCMSQVCPTVSDAFVLSQQ